LGVEVKCKIAEAGEEWDWVEGSNLACDSFKDEPSDSPQQWKGRVWNRYSGVAL
jgi:hypothetical protein